MKLRTVLRRRPFFIPAILTTFFLFSCSGDKGTDIKVDEGPDRSTPESLLLSFAKSYKEKDLEGYGECLDEDYVFVFTPDVADSLHLPPDEPWWGKTEDIESTRNMFEDTVVVNVAFSYEALGEWEAYEEVREDTTYLGLFRRFDPIIVVTVSAHSEYDPILYFRVDQSWLDVMVVPDQHTEGLWCILSIEEVEKQLLQALIASAVSATEGTSWGNIKSMWR